MITIDARMDESANRFQVRLDQFPKELQDRFEAKIRELTNQMLRLVQAREPVRTGRLRSQTHAYVDKNPVKLWVRGRVRILPVQTGVNRTAAAFGALEYGAPGKSGRRTGKVEVAGYLRGRDRVSAYQRKRPRIQARRFLRSSMAVMAPKARAELQQVLNQAAVDLVK